jgi:hypothetical protein
MTTIVDLSQIISATIYMGDAHTCAQNPSEQSASMIKHSVFNSIRANHVLHKARYGRTVLACDSGSWRYDVFPQYKHSRKVKRETDTSGINWEFVSAVKEDLISDLEKFFPFPLIKCPKTEGDDILGVLAKLITETPTENTDTENIFGDSGPEEILLVSNDADNYQIHELGKHIRQWSPMGKKLVRPDGSPKLALLEKIVKGDVGDGIPNIRMHDSVFVDKIRQKPISQKFLDSFFVAANPIDACTNDDERKNYARNEQLVSYSKIPIAIRQSIIVCYNEQLEKKHSKMVFMNYLTQNRMSNILSNIHDFY